MTEPNSCLMSNEKKYRKKNKYGRLEEHYWYSCKFNKKSCNLNKQYGMVCYKRRDAINE